MKKKLLTKITIIACVLITSFSFAQKSKQFLLAEENKQLFGQHHKKSPHFEDEIAFLKQKEKKKSVNKMNSANQIYLMDSILYFDTLTNKIFKSLITYDSIGQIYSLTSGFTGTNGNYSTFYKHTYTYDNQGNVLIDLEEYNLTNHNRKTYTYDSQGNILTVLRERWENSSNSWRNSDKYTYTVNQQGNILYKYKLQEDWNSNNNTWVNSYKYTWTYDAQGNKLSELTQYWSNNTWLNDNLEIYTYDTQGKILSFIFKDSYNGVFLSQYKNTYSYNSQGYLVNILNEDSINNAYVTDYRETYYYNSQNNLISMLAEDWINTSWENVIKRSYSYDSYNNRTSEVIEEWKNNTWVNGSRYVMDINIGYPQLDWVYCHYYTAHFSLHNSSVGIGEEKNNVSLSAYPNPSSGLFTIAPTGENNIAQMHVEVSNLLGAAVYNTNVNNNNGLQLDLSQQPKGIYFLKLTNELGAVVGQQKLIVN